MVPSEGKDFTGSHGGFEGEAECQFYLPAGWAIQVLDERRNLFCGYTSPASGWLVRALNPFARVNTNPLPLPDGNAE